MTVHLIAWITITVTVHLIVFLLRFRSAFARSELALGEALDAGEKAIIAEWPADAFGGAQVGD